MGSKKQKLTKSTAKKSKPALSKFKLTNEFFILKGQDGWTVPSDCIAHSRFETSSGEVYLVCKKMVKIKDTETAYFL